MSEQIERAMTNDEGPSYAGVTAEQVRDFLAAHPDFLDENPDLLRVLTPPGFHDGDRVVDMQRFMVERMRQQIEALQKEFTDLLFSARDNLSVQTQIHEAVKHVLDSKDFATLMHVISHDLQRIFAVDVVKLCIEGDVVPFQDPEFSALQFISRGTVDRLVGKERTIVLGSEPLPLEHVFASANALVESYALVRLSFETGEGMIAFGVRHKEQFHDGQGTEFLAFLAHVLEDCLSRLWKGHGLEQG